MKKGTLALLSALLGVAAGAAGSSYMGNKKIEQKAQKVDKFKSYYNMLNQWLILKQEGKSLKDYFNSYGYKTVAIYGMGEMGNRLYEELKGTEIEVKYAVDQNAASTYSELDVLEKEDDFEKVDVMIVTATFAFDEIEAEIADKVDFPIVSLEDVVYEI